MNLLLPLMVYLAVVWWQGSLRRVGYVIWMMVAFALEFYTFLEAFAQMSLLFAVAFLDRSFPAVAGREYRRKVARLAGVDGDRLPWAASRLAAAVPALCAGELLPTTLVRGADHFHDGACRA